MSFDYYEFKREKRAYNRTAPKKLDYIYALEAKGIYPRLNTRLKALKAICEERGIKVYSNHFLSPAYNGASIIENRFVNNITSNVRTLGQAKEMVKEVSFNF